MGTFAKNLSYAIRAFWNNPGFAAVVVLTLALGIGANTAIFSVVHSALLRPLPYRETSRLVHLGESREQFAVDINQTQVSYPDFLDWKRATKSFESLAAYNGDGFTIAANGEPKNTFAAQVTPSFFSTLGVKPALGRDFLENEMQSDGPHVTILTDALWRAEFGADPNVIGRVIHLDSKPVTIVGVLLRRLTPPRSGYRFTRAAISSRAAACAGSMSSAGSRPAFLRIRLEWKCGASTYSSPRHIRRKTPRLSSRWCHLRN
jgi:hypothetical protein